VYIILGINKQTLFEYMQRREGMYLEYLRSWNTVWFLWGENSLCPEM